MRKALQDLVEALENRAYGTGVLITAVEHDGHGIVKINDAGGKGGAMLHVDNILAEMDAGTIDSEEGAEQAEELYISLKYQRA